MSQRSVSFSPFEAAFFWCSGRGAGDIVYEGEIRRYKLDVYGCKGAAARNVRAHDGKVQTVADLNAAREFYVLLTIGEEYNGVWCASYEMAERLYAGAAAYLAAGGVPAWFDE